MQSGHITLNIAKQLLRVHRVSGIRCVSGYRLTLCVINSELSLLSAGLVAPPRLTFSKYYPSQDSIDFSVFLSLSCLRAFRRIRIAASRAIFVASGFVRCILSLLTQQSRVLLVFLPLFGQYRFSRVKSPLQVESENMLHSATGPPHYTHIGETGESSPHGPYRMCK